MSTNRDQRVYAMYRAAKRRGEFHYGEGRSPYLIIARAFRMPVIQARGIVAEMRQRRREDLRAKRHGA